MKSLDIIAPLSSLSNRTRLFKLAKFMLLQDKNTAIKHVGWQRIKGESEEIYFSTATIQKKILMSGGGYGGKKVKLLYILWMIKVFFYCLRLPADKAVWALGFETAFPALLASKFRKNKVIFDDADRFSMVFSMPSLIKSMVEKLERYTSRNVFMHIIPGKERYDFESNNFFILKNMPSQSELDLAQEIFKNKVWPKAGLIINVNGWLGEDRGMAAALALSQAFKNDDFKIILAGKIDCPAAKALSQQDNVVYLGSVSNSEALASYLCSDFVLTYYDPKHKINQFAESNKWGDAIMSGVKIIVNSEVKTAQFLNKEKWSISVPYHDHSMLITKVRTLINNKKSTFSFEPTTTTKFKPFEVQLKSIIHQIEVQDVKTK
ncbi:MAG: hypothetical protein MJK12_08570 [Colwellia sp.]|nr:hypothetical protein [Colwellia sp.]